jgi:hypothetical protein
VRAWRPRRARGRRRSGRPRGRSRSCRSRFQFSATCRPVCISRQSCLPAVVAGEDGADGPAEVFQGEVDRVPGPAARAALGLLGLFGRKREDS